MKRKSIQINTEEFKDYTSTKRYLSKCIFNFNLADRLVKYKLKLRPFPNFSSPNT